MQVVKKGPKHLHEEFLMIEFFERLHWSYDDYMNAPVEIVELILEKRNLDAKASQHGG